MKNNYSLIVSYSLKAIRLLAVIKSDANNYKFFKPNPL